MSCDKCQSLCIVVEILKPADYRTLIRVLIERIDRNELRIVHGVALAPLLMEDSVWPDDIISHSFQCVTCGQKFELSVDTYHGIGGSWQTVHQLNKSS
jgi:hypothetical protein